MWRSRVAVLAYVPIASDCGLPQSGEALTTSTFFEAPILVADNIERTLKIYFYP